MFKTLFRVLIDYIEQNIFDWLFATVDLMWLLKFLTFVLIVRISLHFAGCLSVVIVILLWLFN